MKVTIELFGVLREVAKIPNINMPIDGKAHASDALKYIKGKYPDIPLDIGSFLIIINHETVSRDRILQPDDVICFIPHIGGG